MSARRQHRPSLLDRCERPGVDAIVTSLNPMYIYHACDVTHSQDRATKVAKALRQAFLPSSSLCGFAGPCLSSASRMKSAEMPHRPRGRKSALHARNVSGQCGMRITRAAIPTGTTTSRTTSTALSSERIRIILSNWRETFCLISTVECCCVSARSRTAPVYFSHVRGPPLLSAGSVSSSARWLQATGSGAITLILIHAGGP